MLDDLFWLAVGWVLCILFPIPYLNQAVIDLYNNFWGFIKTKITSAPVPGPTLGLAPVPVTVVPPAK